MSNRGWVYYQQDDPETAMLEFDEAIEQDPTFVLAYWGRAAVRSGEGEWDAAIKDYSQAIRNSSDKRELAELYTERGDTNHSAGNVRKALRDFERATQKDPDYAQAHGSRANVLLEEEAFDEALKAITNAIKLDGELHNLLGDIYTAQENLEPSLAAYTAAINCDDENAIFYRNRGISHRQLENLDQAAKDLRKAASLEPDNDDLFNELALVYYRAGGFREAVKQFSEAIRLDDGNPFYWFNRGDAHYQMGDNDNAVSDLTQSLALNEDADAYALRGRANERLGELDAARKDYKQAVESGPDTYRLSRLKQLRITNATGEALRVWVQYLTGAEGEKPNWQPMGAADEGNAVRFDFPVDQSATLVFNGAKIRASRFRVWAKGIESNNEYLQFKDKDLVLVLDSGYATDSDEPVTETYTIAKAHATKGTPTPPRPATAFPRSVTINTLSYYTAADGTADGRCTPVQITVDKNPTKTLKVAFIEDSIDSYGGMWRAAAWMATVMAADVTGFNPLSTQVSFERQGRVDGPSAGGLMTAGVLAALRGDTLRADAAMTGTINPDGTIGPVGGIVHKMVGAAKSGKKLVLIPHGLRYEKNQNTGELVDLFIHGRKLGLEVKAVGDIYSAYQALTGAKLPRAEPAQTPALEVDMYQRIVIKVTERLKRYKEFEDIYAKTPNQYHTDDGKTMLEKARASVKRAEGLLVEGQAPAAFQDAFQAAQAAGVAAELDRAVWIADQRGLEAAKKFVHDSAKLDEKMEAALNALKKHKPETLSATGVLLHGYATLIQGMACQAVAEALQDGSFAFSTEGTETERKMVAILLSSVYTQIAAQNYENISDVLDIAGHTAGRPLPKDAPIAVTTLFFRRAAEANLNQFERTVVHDRAKSANIPLDKMKLAMMQHEQGYLITRFAMDKAIPKLVTALNGDPALPYAVLGSAVQTYTMSSRLMAEHYSLGVIHDEDGNVTGLRKEAPLKNMLDFSEDQVRRNIQVLREHDVEPMASVFFYQVGSNFRGRGLEDRLGALTALWQANVQARTLAYLGGFAAPAEKP